MYSSGWLFRGLKPAPAPDSPFQPYDLTAEAAGHLADAMHRFTRRYRLTIFSV